MKTFLKIFAVVIVILLLTVIILPYAFKGKIIELAKTEINKQINAKVDFAQMDFGLISSFPDFRLTIDNLSIVEKNVFQDDTLAFVPKIKVVFSLLDVLKGDYTIKKINLTAPQINIHVLDDGRVNYDIATSSSSGDVPVAASAESETSEMQIALRHFGIENGSITYRDAKINLLMQITGLNHSLRGDLSASRTVLYTQTSVADMLISLDGVNYLNHAAIRYQANLDADLANNIFTFGKNELMVNQLKLNFAGSVSLLDAGINMVLTYNTPSTQFNELLSLIPKVYLKDIQGIKTTGKFSLNGAVKGMYSHEKYPEFALSLEVKDATAKYPDLPGTIEQIQVSANISSPGGDLDNMVVDVKKLHLELGKNPIDAQLKLATPFSDPDLESAIKARIDLATLKNYYPIDSTNALKGVVVADVTLKGKLSAIEQEKYEAFLAMGSVVLQNLEYSTPGLKNPVAVSMAQLNFSPRYIDLVSFALKTGGSDITASGKLTNYLAWYFKNETLDGTLAVNSNFFNLDDILDTSEQPDTTVNVETTVTENPVPASDTEANVPQVPENIRFVLGCNFKQLIYDNLDMSQVSGKIIVADSKITLNNMRMQVSGGTMQVNGTYASPSLKSAETSLFLKLNNLDIPTAYKQFALFRRYLPLAEQATGKFNASLDFTTKLDAGLMPIYESLNGNGWISSNQIRVENLSTLEEAARLVNYKELSDLTLEKVLVEFKFIDGKLVVDPFEMKYKGVKSTISGWTELDGKIGYTMQVEVPRKELGTDLNKLLDSFVGEANKLGANFSVDETIPFELSIGGTLEEPTVTALPGKVK